MRSCLPSFPANTKVANVRVCTFHQMRLFKMGAAEVLSTLLSPKTAPSTQASAAWAIGTLCTGVTEIQHSYRVDHDGRVLQLVVDLLDSDNFQVYMRVGGSPHVTWRLFWPTLPPCRSCSYPVRT